MARTHSWTPADLFARAGTLPTLFAAAALAAAAPALAQPGGGGSSPGAPKRSGGGPAKPSPGIALAAEKLGGAMGRDPAQPRDPMKPAARDGEGPDVRVSEHMTVELHVKDENLTDVLALLSVQSQRNIIASKNVGGKISADLYGVTFYEALDAILHVNGFGYIEQGNFIYVYTLEELQEIQKALHKRVTKVVRLNYLNAVDAAEFVTPMLSEAGEIKTTKKTENFSIADKSPVGKDDYALTAILVITDYEENVEAIEKLLTELDTRPAQVLVEATILQTSLTEANAFGVDFSIIGDLNFTDFTSPTRAAQSLILGGGSNSDSGDGDGDSGGGGGGGKGFSPEDDRGTAISSTPGQTAGPGTFKLGVIAEDIAVFVKMLDEVTDTTILSNPKILALNRQPARVLVGRRVGYLNTTATDTSTTQSVQFLDTGTQLNFRPFVSASGEIRMELKPQVSEAIIREATDASGASVSIPDEVTQEIVTNVIVRDGNTIVLGGLFRESTSAGRRQVPLVGDIPIVGAAFRGHDDQTQRSEIIFLITPTIVSESVLIAQGSEAEDQIHRIRAGSRQGLLPWSREKMTQILNLEAERDARNGDTDRALWNLQRSLALNPRQPDALHLREQITSDREVWPDRSGLTEIIDPAFVERLRQIQPATPPVRDKAPYGSHPVPRQPVTPRPPRVDAAPASAPEATELGAMPEPTMPTFTGTMAKDHAPDGTSLGTGEAQPVAPALAAAGEAAAGGQPMAPAAPVPALEIVPDGISDGEEAARLGLPAPVLVLEPVSVLDSGAPEQRQQDAPEAATAAADSAGTPEPTDGAVPAPRARGTLSGMFRGLGWFFARARDEAPAVRSVEVTDKPNLAE